MKARHQLARQAGRATLLLVAFIAPWLVYIIRAVQADRDAHIEGVLWGGAGSVLALVVFAMSFKTSAIERLVRFGQGLIPIVIAWFVILFGGTGYL